MKQTRLLMGMPITIVINDVQAGPADFDYVFAYFESIDEQFSPYKPTSEVSRINQGLAEREWSATMKHIMKLAEQTSRTTHGYFDVYHNGQFDPSGIVKGWAINNAARLLRERHCTDFYIDAGGDIQTAQPVTTTTQTPWRVGIRSPFNREEIVKVLELRNEGIATSGTAIRGDHIYNPVDELNDNTVASLTVVGPNVYEADRFATAAFAMGRRGVDFIETLEGFEGYMIDTERQATLTSGFERYVVAA
jgi:thiamine biosynthesis lipoprotein